MVDLCGNCDRVFTVHDEDLGGVLLLVDGGLTGIV